MLTPEELTQARQLSDPEIFDGDEGAKQPARQLVRKMLAHIDSVTTERESIRKSALYQIDRADRLDTELHAALDAKEKAEALATKLNSECDYWKNLWDMRGEKLLALQVDKEKAEAELCKAKVEAETLATSIWRSEFQSSAPEWALCDTVAGVISQIDNMHAGVRGQRDKLQSIVDEQRKENDTLGLAHHNALALVSDSVQELYDLRGERQDWKDDPRCNRGKYFDGLNNIITRCEAALSAAASSGAKEKQS